MKKKNKNGFTLIELIAVITITGVVSLFTIPALGKVISDNSTRACKYYERAMVEASRSYIMKEETDILERYGSFPSNYTLNKDSLVSYGYLENYTDTRTMVTAGSVAVNYDSSTKTYTYTVHITCKKKNGEQLYTK